MNQLISKNDEIVVDAKVHLVFVSLEGKPIKIPEEIYSKFKPFFCGGGGGSLNSRTPPFLNYVITGQY